MVHNANGLYPHWAQISNEFNSSCLSKRGILACHGYSFEEIRDAFDMHPFTYRVNSLGTKKFFHSMGVSPLRCLPAKCFYYRIPKLDKLIRAGPNFMQMFSFLFVSVKHRSEISI